MALRDISQPEFLPELPPMSADEAAEAAIDAYVYAYPLVLMELTRRLVTDVAEPDSVALRAPTNQFVHAQAFPDAAFNTVVRPNADTLYSALSFDVAREPLILELPETRGRYYLLQMLDFWTDVFAAPGKRTTGTSKQTLALIAPEFAPDRRGALPPHALVLRAPTPRGLILGRFQTDGPADFAAVHQLQAQLTAAPLGAWKNAAPPPAGRTSSQLDLSPPAQQIERLDALAFFTLFGQLSGIIPPHANDYPMLHRLERIGLPLGRPFDLARLTGTERAAILAAPAPALANIKLASRNFGTAVNGWSVLTAGVGTYGADYLRRAAIAYAGLGANSPSEAIYPFALADSEGRPFDSSAGYALRFAPGQTPPVRAFWSLSLYDDRQYFTANPIHRFAIGDRDPLRFNADGSLDLYIQRVSPGEARQSNWLPAPASGGFSLNLRLYWPKAPAMNGTWTPPPVRRLQ